MPTTELAKLLVRSRVDWCRVRATLAVRGRVSVAVRARAGASTRSEVRRHSQRRHVWSPEAVMIRCFPGTHTRSNMALWCACHSVRKWPATKTSNVCRLERARAKWAQPCGCSHAYARGGAACAQGRRLAAGHRSHPRVRHVVGHAPPCCCAVRVTSSSVTMPSSSATATICFAPASGQNWAQNGGDGLRSCVSRRPSQQKSSSRARRHTAARADDAP